MIKRTVTPVCVVALELNVFIVNSWLDNVAVQ